MKGLHIKHGSYVVRDLFLFHLSCSPSQLDASNVRVMGVNHSSLRIVILAAGHLNSTSISWRFMLRWKRGKSSEKTARLVLLAVDRDPEHFSLAAQTPFLSVMLRLKKLEFFLEGRGKQLP